MGLLSRLDTAPEACSYSAIAVIAPGYTPIKHQPNVTAVVVFRAGQPFSLIAPALRDDIAILTPLNGKLREEGVNERDSFSSFVSTAVAAVLPFLLSSELLHR